MNSRTVKRLAYSALAGTLLIHAFLFWKDRGLVAKGYPDFTIFYSAGLIIRHGLAHQLYDEAVQYRVQHEFAAGVSIRQGALPYNHPPFEALIFVPLTFLPYLMAYFIWNLLNVGMLSVAVKQLRPHIDILNRRPTVVWVLILLAFFPVFFALLQGQDVIMLFLLQSFAFAALKKDSDFASGCWLGLGSFKYHLVLPVVILIWLGWKRSKVLSGFVATCVCLGVASVALVGWAQAARYPEYVLNLERVMGHGAILPASMPNLRGLIEGWKTPERLTSSLHLTAVALSVGFLLWAIVTLRSRTRDIEVPFVLVMTTALLVGYHTLSYDLILLAIPCFVVLDLTVSSGLQLPRNPKLWIPVVLLWCTPLYAVLSFPILHMNLFALVLVFWLWGARDSLVPSSLRVYPL